MGSESGSGLGLGMVQLLLGSTASADGWSVAGLRRSPTELLALLHGDISSRVTILGESEASIGLPRASIGIL